MGPLGYLHEVWARGRGWYPVEMGGLSYHCDPDHISFWSRVNSGKWEPETFAVLDRLLTPDSVHCDLGAWIGPTVLHAASNCGKVYCLEPDRVAYMYLLQNVTLNHLENVLPFNVALSGRNELCRMASPRGKQGDSMTSLLVPGGAAGMEVLCLRWQTWLELAGKPEFDSMKIDIEGGEFALIPTMKDYLEKLKPSLFLSLHPHLLPESERAQAMKSVVEVLQLYGNCYESEGKKVDMQSLMEAQAVNQAGCYLLLP